MFSSTSEYALRAVVHLAVHEGESRSSLAIASATKVPSGYLSKILKDLVTAGIVLSQRGPSGGFTLAQPARAISILDVINAVDRFQRIKECPLGIPSHGQNLCRLHQRLDDTLATVEKTLAESTIADMASGRRVGKTCVFPTIGGEAVPAEARQRASARGRR